MKNIVKKSKKFGRAIGLKKHRELQRSLEEYVDVPHITLYTNGHLALENAIAASNLPE